MGGKGGGGKKGGGGGGGSIDVDVDSDSDATTVLDIVGLDDINIDATVSTTTSNTNVQRIEVPEPIRTSTEMLLRTPDIIRTSQQQRNELAITEPIVTQMSTDMDVDVDVKPVVVDLCLTLGIKDPPRFCVSRPYDKRIGLSLFGNEVVGVAWSGTSQVIVDDVRPGGFLAGVVNQPHGGKHRHHDSHHDHDHDHDHSHDHDDGHGHHHDDGHDSGRHGVRFVI